MNKKYKNLLYGVLVVLACLEVYLWWSLRADNLIVGTWKGENSQIIKVYSGDTFSIPTPNGTINGAYKILDNQDIRVDLGGMAGVAGPQIIKYDVSVSRLIISDGKTPITLERTSDLPLILEIYKKIKG